jgi:hypothetical protein
MKMNERVIQVKCGDELVELENALIAGKESDGLSTTALYMGRLDLDELHNALFYANTGVLKILTEQFEIPLENCDDFLLSALSEAFTRELNVQHGHAPDVNVSKVIKYRKQ